MARYEGLTESMESNELNTISKRVNRQRSAEASNDKHLEINVDEQNRPRGNSDSNPSADETGNKEGSRRKSKQRLTKYGVRFEPPTDFGLQYPLDNRYSFFAKGREIAGSSNVHIFSAKEKQVLSTFESQDYLPAHSDAYKQYLRRRTQSFTRFLGHDYDRWLTMAFVGVTIGLIGFMLHQLIDLINYQKWEITKAYAYNNQPVEAWLVSSAYSLGFVLFASATVTYIRPSAAGSGIPELIGFLNGSLIRHIFNIKTLIVKFLSCVAAVGSGLPVGPEGPMIHMGSLVGAGISQFKSDTLHFSLPLFRHFRNAQDRRNFIQAGAAAGVSTAFHAPVGGLLFAMEEVSSFWNLNLTWQIFFCCMVATFTTALFNSAFIRFDFTGTFGLFTEEGYVMFPVNQTLYLSILAFLPAIVLGIVGGLLGALFVFLHLKFARARFFILAHIKSTNLKNLAKVGECLLISLIMSSLAILLPTFWSCTSVEYAVQQTSKPEGNGEVLNCTGSTMSGSFEVVTYGCSNCTYNEMGTLMWSTASNAISLLWRRNTHNVLQHGVLAVLLLVNFIGSSWASSSSLSSGLVIPMLLIGSLYGRFIGRLATDIIGVEKVMSDQMFSWADPGVMALIGAASFFAGVTRCTMSLTVIMIELTSDVQFLLPIMVAVMVAKWVGDFLTHPIYHANLEVKCIPYLEHDPEIYFEDQRLNLELFSARHVMSSPAVTVRLREMVSHVARLLLDTNHCGFPVVKKLNDEEVFIGSITRLELTVLLMRPDLFADESVKDTDIDQDVAEEVDDDNITDTERPVDIEYEQTNIDKLGNPGEVEAALQKYADDATYHRKYVRLGPYINRSAMTVERNFSLQRTYIISRALGLRHLFVTDSQNRVMGVITRKDLMTSTMQERLAIQVRQMLDAHAKAHINKGGSNDSGFQSSAVAQLPSVAATSSNASTAEAAKNGAIDILASQLDSEPALSVSTVLASNFGVEPERRGELLLELN